MFNLDISSKVLLILLVVGVWGLLLKSVIPFPSAEAQSKSKANQSNQISPVIKTRGLIIVDDKGRERILMGAPVPDPPGEGKRINPANGMIILDPEGYERFGLGLMDNGTMGMGFDAPRGKGDDRNPERIHISADSEGGAMIRFLNRKTLVPGWLRLGEDDNLYLEFLDVQREKKKVIKRRIGMKGDQTIEEPLK